MINIGPSRIIIIIEIIYLHILRSLLGSFEHFCKLHKFYYK